ncbi:lysophospholipid acyltransferase family protein [Longispora albida]|uniref:lysophospholipid acyltransferase family protein n=1 Tax=Longispora albida TaxID=203523 RepID=UPI0003802B10|nr:lysophospholipid acyltransferase family protein [Longispora albida]
MNRHDGPAGLGWVPESPCTTGCLPGPAAGRAGALRRVARWAGVFGLLLAGAFHPPALRRLARVLGVRVSLRGSFGQGELIVANHMSWLDVVVLLAVSEAAPLAKSEVSGWPLVGRIARRIGTVFVDRGRPRALPDTVATLTWVLRAGRSVLVFPEGTTWCGAQMGPFRRAAFQAAIEAGARVRPVALRYGTRAASFVGDDTLFASIGRITGMRHVDVEVIVLPGLEPDRSRRRLASAAENAVRAELGQHQSKELARL